MVYVLFLLWFVFLVKWAEYLVEWASNVAKKFHISDFFIGLTIVAIGTSLPELVVNINASLQHSSWLVLGNIVGSNISNLLLILWITALIFPITTSKSILNKEYIVSMASLFFLYYFLNNWFLFSSTPTIERYEALLLLWFFFVFIFLSAIRSKQAIVIETEKFSLKKSILFIIIWLVWLVLWWEWVVNWAIKIANVIGLSERVIGLTIVAIGTSLPELITSIVAARHHKTDMALGNIIWSNIANVLLIIGMSWAIYPIKGNISIQYDILFLFIASIIVYFLFKHNKNTVWRIAWLIMLVLYGLYIASILIIK